MRENIINEKNSGRLFGYFGQYKTFSQVNAFYYLPKMQNYVNRFIEKHKICQHAKGRNQNIGLY